MWQPLFLERTSLHPVATGRKSYPWIKGALRRHTALARTRRQELTRAAQPSGQRGKTRPRTATTGATKWSAKPRSTSSANGSSSNDTGTRRGSHHAERRAQQLIAASFFVLALFVSIEAAGTLANGTHPQTSWVGIGLAAVTAATMPLLARAKCRVGNQLHSSATVKEASQTQLCAFISIALLLGLGAKALAGWWWADPLAAFFIAAVAGREGRQSWRGEGCCDLC